MSSAIFRMIEYVEYKGISKYSFYKKTGLSNGFLDKNRNIGSDKCEIISDCYSDLNLSWLITGEGSMLKDEQEPTKTKGRHLIPFYEDVRSIGGCETVADVGSSTHPSEMIDAGDWFPEATAAIRHYGDSMVEYPSGSILAIKRVNDHRLIVWGRNYVVETSEFRITKQLQDGDDAIIAYSSNRDTYPDGRTIHSPVHIPKDAITCIDLVLGCVTKEYSNGPVAII